MRRKKEEVEEEQSKRWRAERMKKERER